jgi:hypothetical protein
MRGERTAVMSRIRMEQGLQSAQMVNTRFPATCDHGFKLVETGKITEPCAPPSRQSKIYAESNSAALFAGSSEV